MPCRLWRSVFAFPILQFVLSDTDPSIRVRRYNCYSATANSRLANPIALLGNTQRAAEGKFRCPLRYAFGYLHLYRTKLPPFYYSTIRALLI